MAWEKLGTATVGGGAVANTSWKEVGRETLSSGATSITCSFTPKDNHMVLYSRTDSTGATGNGLFRLGYNSVDDGSNYSERYSHYGNSDTTATGQSGFGQWDTGGINRLDVMEFANISGQEKITIGHNNVLGATGAGSAPYRVEYFGKWANTSNQANRVYWENSYSSGGGLAAGTEIVVLGYDNDEADSGTNFWQELASVESSATDDTITTGTIASKKYLMVEFYATYTGDCNSVMVFNSDTGSNYAQRNSFSGGSDGTNTSRSDFTFADSSVHDSIYCISYILNISNKEKLIISQQSVVGTAGATNTPARAEQVGKWTNTSNQITNITMNQSGSGSYTYKNLKVYGSD